VAYEDDVRVTILSEVFSVIFLNIPTIEIQIYINIIVYFKVFKVKFYFKFEIIDLIFRCYARYISI
jgi:hypothetical protein